MKNRKKMNQFAFMQTKLLYCFFFSAFFLLSVNVYSQKEKVNVKVINGTLKEAFKQIESQSEFKFLYNNADVDVNKKINIDVKKMAIADVLKRLLPQKINVQFDNSTIILSQKKEPSKTSVRINVHGQVFDENNDPIIGASILEKGTQNGTVTDIEGKYSLNVANSSIIQYSYLGYATVERKASASTMDVKMKEDSKLIDEVVVVGYGVLKKKLVTGATVQVSGEKIAKTNAVDVFGALQSQATGVNITQNSGQPGESFKINIRGLGTTGSTTPLYVIDGIPGGTITALDPSDVESVDVLKDAASAAIYGARAANGVLIVTTKQGKAGKLKVTYDGYIGFQNPITNGVKTLNAKQYIETINKALEIAGSQPYDFKALIPNHYDAIMNGTWEGTDWFSEATNKNAMMTSHSLNMNGGNDLSRFSLGISYFSQEGTIGKPATPKYDRYAIRLNSDYSLIKKDKRDILKLGENISFTIFDKSGISIGNNYNNNIRDLLTACPLLPAYNKDGELYEYKDMLADEWDFNQDYTNPLESIRYSHKDEATKNYRLQSNAYLEFKPFENLTIRTVGGFQYSHTDFRSYVAAYQLSGKNSNNNDDITQRQAYSTNWTWENTINYIHKYKSHVFDILAGQSIEKWGYGNTISIKNSNSLFPNSYKNAYISNTQGLNTTDTEISGTPNTPGALSSVFGRLNYNWNETYMASAILRADGSSNFAKGNRWGYFPSFSIGWVVTNEKWMQPLTKVLDFFKLRASWGQNGNCDISNFQYLATIAFDAKYFYNDKSNPITGAYPDILPNEDVTWETSEQLDFGFDARLLNSRLGITLDWYNKKTKDWLVIAPQLASYGTNAPYINGGDVKNTGFELSLTWNDKKGDDFSYGASLNISKNKNEVTRIANTEGIIHGAENVLAQNTDELYRVQVGYPMGYFWGYKTDGVIQNEADLKNYLDNHCGGSNANSLQGAGIQAGDLKFVDFNKDGKITKEDKTQIGDPNPHFNLGIGLNLSFRNFDFSLNAHGAFGMQIAKCYRHYSNMPDNNYCTDVYTKYWTGEGSTNRYPRFTDGKHANMKEISDLWIEDADYLKISNISLGYNFKKLWNNMPFENLRVYVSAQNLITLTGYSGMDPEIGYGNSVNWASGIDIGNYPSARTWMCGINLTF